MTVLPLCAVVLVPLPDVFDVLPEVPSLGEIQAEFRQSETSHGLLAPAAKATRLALARQALSVPPPDPVIKATVEDFLRRVGRAEWARCPHCHEGRFVPTAAIPPLRQATPQRASVRGPP